MFAGGAAPAIAARVSYVLPEVDPTTRTLKVRLDAANPGTRMKPDMFVNVEFAVAGPPQLTIPAEAVLDTGDRHTVFVVLGNGYLEPRQVTIGDRFGDRVTVIRGLSRGERIVSSGTFLVDSESHLRAAATGMGAPSAAPQPPAKPPAAPPHEGHRRD
jgi:Cu(I)/Ag(I) efflux system membrane fusion protein